MGLSAGCVRFAQYLFDLRGYLVVKNALTPEQLEDCRARLAARQEKRRELDLPEGSKLSPEERKAHQAKVTAADTHFGSDRTNNRPASEEVSEQAWSANSLIEWGGAFIDLIVSASTAPLPSFCAAEPAAVGAGPADGCAEAALALRRRAVPPRPRLHKLARPRKAGQALFARRRPGSGRAE